MTTQAIEDLPIEADLKEQLREMAADAGEDPVAMVNDVLRKFIADRQYRAALANARASARAGRGITLEDAHAEMRRKYAPPGETDG